MTGSRFRYACRDCGLLVEAADRNGGCPDCGCNLLVVLFDASAERRC